MTGRTVPRPGTPSIQAGSTQADKVELERGERDLSGSAHERDEARRNEGGIEQVTHDQVTHVKVKARAVDRVKKDLTNANKARKIVRDLKKIQLPDSPFAVDDKVGSTPSLVGRGSSLESDPGLFVNSPDSTLGGSTRPKGFVIVASSPRASSLPTASNVEAPTRASPQPDEAMKELRLGTLATNESSPEPAQETSYRIVSLSPTSSPPPTSIGGLAGLASAKTGTFEILAEVTGKLVRKSRRRKTRRGHAIDAGERGRFEFVAPFDTVAVFVYWWGYELSLPPPILVRLKSVQSVQQYFFNLLQLLVVTGGTPELAPFIRYISSYLDMEFSAISSQDKAGHGVVIAATWLVPVALVPRPWDFPLPTEAQAASGLSFPTPSSVSTLPL
ncbi:hypothetical protein JCM10212_003470 [Sporobolomyces blumeae]